MSYAILQISAAAYADIRNRLTALDERLKPDPSNASEYIMPPRALGRPEYLKFGGVLFEALPKTIYDDRTAAELQAATDRAAPAHVDDMNDAVLVGMALEDDAEALRAYFEGESITYAGADQPNHQGVDGIVDLVELARILRRRYLTVEKEEVLQAAARWKALMGAAPRLIGAAGVEFDDGIKAKPDGYIHAGVEFWTKAGVPWIERGREGTAAAVLTLIADQIIAMGGEAWAYEDGERVEVPSKSS